MSILEQAEYYQAEFKRLKAEYPEIYDSPIPSIPEIVKDLSNQENPSFWADDYIY